MEAARAAGEGARAGARREREAGARGLEAGAGTPGPLTAAREALPRGGPAPGATAAGARARNTVIQI